MEVADELQEVRLFLDHDGLVAVLEEVPHAFVPSVERPPQGGVSRLRMARGNGRLRVRTRRWAWLGRSAQA